MFILQIFSLKNELIFSSLIQLNFMRWLYELISHSIYVEPTIFKDFFCFLTTVQANPVDCEIKRIFLAFGVCAAIHIKGGKTFILIIRCLKQTGPFLNVCLQLTLSTSSRCYYLFCIPIYKRGRVRAGSMNYYRIANDA